MTPEIKEGMKQTSIPMKVLEIISTTPLTEEFWTQHQEDRDAIYITREGKLIQTTIIEAGYTTRVETTHGQISISLLHQYCEFPRLYNFPIVLRIVNTGDEEYPVEFYFSSPEADKVDDETSLAYMLFTRLRRTFETKKPKNKILIN
jgi:hypothetical protein